MTSCQGARNRNKSTHGKYAYIGFAFFLSRERVEQARALGLSVGENDPHYDVDFVEAVRAGSDYKKPPAMSFEDNRNFEGKVRKLFSLEFTEQES